MSNKMYNSIKYINWQEEAEKIPVTIEEMKEALREVASIRSEVKGPKTLRSQYTHDTYKIERKGTYVSILYLDREDHYKIITTNAFDDSKNEKKSKIRTDRAFDLKFIELNGLSLRKAFGFSERQFKRNVPKQFYYLNSKAVGKEFIGGSVDACSQYPSGCLGKLPDAHHMMTVRGRAKPTAEWPFAFYKSGHLAIFGELDTHNWLVSKYMPCLFRGPKEDWPLQPLRDEDEETVLMKASEHTMDSVWDYYYGIKSKASHDSEEYLEAKLVMNSTIGYWHRRDADKKHKGTYDDHGSYKLAHVVAVAIARGNQKILDKCREIGEMKVVHICVDGIIYAGPQEYGQSSSELGKFKQEFSDCAVRIDGMNVYAAEKDNKPVKFKHGGYDLIYGHDIDGEYGIRDLSALSKKETIGDILDGKEKEIHG